MAWLKGANRPGAGSAPISTSRRSRAASRRETARRNSAGSATVVDTIILATIRRLSRAGGTPRRPMRVDGSVGGACPCLGYGAAARAPAPSGRAQGADVGHAAAEQVGVHDVGQARAGRITTVLAGLPADQTGRGELTRQRLDPLVGCDRVAHRAEHQDRRGAAPGHRAERGFRSRPAGAEAYQPGGEAVSYT